MENKTGINLIWEKGTAYDLFVSLHVLHNPEKFSLRGSWAAGVRSRLPSGQRKMLEEVDLFLKTPLAWIHSLPDPKDGMAVVRSLAQIPPQERLPALTFAYDTPEQTREILLEVARREDWNEKDVEVLKIAQHSKTSAARSKALVAMLKWWARPAEFGESYLTALRSFYQVFFAEEEEHIRPALNAALERARDLSAKTDLPPLLEDLSQGVRFSTLQEASELVLSPSYWITPLVLYTQINAQRTFILFGARPEGASLVPGEFVPEQLLRALKSLADPTRLRILRYLVEESHTPAQLSRRLRLRPPTVIHHLTALRLAGLVHVVLEEGGERRYSARTEVIPGTFSSLMEFLGQARSDRLEGPRT